MKIKTEIHPCLTMQTIPTANGVAYYLSNGLGWEWSKFLEGYLESLARVLTIQIQLEVTEFRAIASKESKQEKID